MLPVKVNQHGLNLATVFGRRAGSKLRVAPHDTYRLRLPHFARRYRSECTCPRMFHYVRTVRLSDNEASKPFTHCPKTTCEVYCNTCRGFHPVFLWTLVHAHKPHEVEYEAYAIHFNDRRPLGLAISRLSSASGASGLTVGIISKSESIRPKVSDLHQPQHPLHIDIAFVASLQSRRFHECFRAHVIQLRALLDEYQSTNRLGTD